MLNIKEFFKRNGVVICLTVTFLAATAASITLHIKQAKIQEKLVSEVAELTSKIAAMTNELGTAKTDAELAKKEPEELKAKLAELTNDIAAFARQAKSCEEIKKKFKAK